MNRQLLGHAARYSSGTGYLQLTVCSVVIIADSRRGGMPTTASTLTWLLGCESPMLTHEEPHEKASTELRDPTRSPMQHESVMASIMTSGYEGDKMAVHTRGVMAATRWLRRLSSETTSGDHERRRSTWRHGVRRPSDSSFTMPFGNTSFAITITINHRPLTHWVLCRAAFALTKGPPIHYR